MKRRASVDDSSPKRLKLDSTSIFNDPKLERTIADVFDRDTKTGFIRCRCFMAWRPSARKHQVILETVPPRHRFQVEFTGDCAKFFNELEIKAQDRLFLGLKGVNKVILKDVPRSCTLATKLVFSGGVLMSFTNRRGINLENDKYTINTWELDKIVEIQSPDRFASLDVANNEEIHRHVPPPTPIPQPPALAPSISEDLPSVEDSRPASSSINLDAGVLGPQPPSHASSDSSKAARGNTTTVQTMTKKQQKKQRKLMKQREAAGAGVTLPPATVAIITSGTECNSNIRREPSSCKSPILVTRMSPDEGVAQPAVASTRIPPPAPTASTSNTPETTLFQSDLNQLESESSGTEPVGPLAMKAGICADSDNYPALSTLTVDKLCHVIGIVTYAGPPGPTRMGELMCSIKLSDPSNTTLSSLSSSECFQINCFTKRYKEWLPRPSLGEIVILKHVKVVEFYGKLMGTGYSDKVQWAIFSPTSGKIYHGDLGDAPKSACISDGYGHDFTPFFEPGEATIRYCSRLSDWWRELAKKQKEAMGVVHQIGEDAVDTFTLSTRVPRKHRLISEAGPSVPPSGFFDCIVEVLHGHANDNGVYSLYVTDYSLNPSITPVQGVWCPKGLSEYVLKCEMWDDAAKMGKIMMAGEYYCIKNARMRVSLGGYVEGKIVEPKINKLELDPQEASRNPFLTALIERKAAWQALNPDTIPNDFEDSIIAEALEDVHFNCVVEVLHAICGPNGKSCIYVTDYSMRSELLSQDLKGEWTNGLDGRILKINLFDNQEEMAKQVEVGSIYSIKKLRLKKSQTGRRFQGRLGGTERLISLINPKNTQDILPLTRRKEKLKKTSSGDIVRGPPPSVNRRPGRTISEMQASECPNKFRVFARIIDFYPWDLRNAVILQCKKCKERLPKNQNGCHTCIDFDHDFLDYEYQLYFRIEDEEGNELDISVDNGCGIFEGLKRTDIQSDRAGYGDLLNRLKPMIGNLVEVHEAITDKVEMVSDTPLVSLILASWAVENQRAYRLMECEEVAR